MRKGVKQQKNDSNHFLHRDFSFLIICTFVMKYVVMYYNNYIFILL
jgi:hypothetical protein